MIFPKSIQMKLISHKCEILSKCQNKIFHIMHDGFFHNSFIYILPISNIQLFYINVIKKILIFKSINCAESLLCRRKRLIKIIG